MVTLSPETKEEMVDSQEIEQKRGNGVQMGHYVTI